MHYEQGKVGTQGSIYFRGAQGDRATRDIGLVRDAHPVEPIGALPRRWEWLPGRAWKSSARTSAG
eukprot:9658262-Alexandrium_andersonii.AAC.1